MSFAHAEKTDSELLRAADLPTLIRYGLGVAGPHRRALFGDGSVAAALTLDQLGTLPRSVAFLAKIVRSGGVRYAADLPEPVPGPAATTVRAWLSTAASVVPGPAGDETAARWLEAVAAVMAARHAAGTAHTPAG